MNGDLWVLRSEQLVLRKYARSISSSTPASSELPHLTHLAVTLPAAVTVVARFRPKR